MAETVAALRPSAEEAAACAWLTGAELEVYAEEFARTGFQGGLQWYRCMTSPHYVAQLRLFSRDTIDVPSMFIGGRQDWGIYQKPGDIDKMQAEVCTDFRGCHLVAGAGHWVQQEQPDDVNAVLSAFLRGTTGCG